MAVANLQIRVGAQTATAKQEFDALNRKIDGFTRDFQKHTAQVQTATRGISSVFSNIAQSAAGFAAGFGIAQVAMQGFNAVVSLVGRAITGAFDAITGAVRKAVDFGDSMFALSQKTRISVEELSALKFVAGQTNTDLNTITNAVFKMQTTLGQGSKATQKAIGELGLSLTQLRTAGPAEAFTSILQRLGEIPNATQRAALGAQIFGRQFKEVAQLTEEDIGGLITKARELGAVMSTEAAVAADRFSDAMADLEARAESLKVRIGAALLPGLIAFAETISRAWGDAVKQVGLSSQGMVRLFDAAVVSIGKGAANIVKAIALMTDAFVIWAGGAFLRNAAILHFLSDLQERVTQVGKAIGILTGNVALAKAMAELERLAKGQKAFLEGTISAVSGASTALHTIAETVANAAQRVGDDFAVTYDRVKREIAAAADEMRRKTRVIGDGAAEADVEFRKLLKTIRELGPALQIGLTSMPGMMLPKPVPPPTAPTLPTVSGIPWPGKLPGIETPIEIPIDPSFLEKAFGSAEQFGANAATAILNGLRGGLKGVGSALGSMLGEGVFKTLADSLTKNMSGLMKGILGTLLPGLGALIGSLLGPALEKIADVFDRDKGRDLVENFAASFGGFDALQKKLEETFSPAEAHRLWTLLTQKVGRNDTAQARAAIEEVTRAFERQAQVTRESEQAAEDLSRKQQEAADAVSAHFKGRLDAIDSEMQSLSRSIEQEAPEKVMGVIEQQQRARVEALEHERSEVVRMWEEAMKEVTETIKREFRTLEIPPVVVPVELDMPNNPTIKVGVELPDAVEELFPNLARLQHGGIVRKPTLALIGEAGPEAVVPLQRTGTSFPRPGSGGNVIIRNMVLNSQTGDPRQLSRDFWKEIRRGGKARDEAFEALGLR